MSACSGELMIFWPLLITIFLGNHHNNPRNSLLWPITQTRRGYGDPKSSRLESNKRASSVGKVMLGEIVDVLEVVGDVVVGGEGAAVGLGRIEGLPRHPTLHLYPPCCPLPHCVFGLLPVCVYLAQPFVLIIPSLRSELVGSSGPLRVRCSQLPSTAKKYESREGKAELDLPAAFWRRIGGGGASLDVWREAGSLEIEEWPPAKPEKPGCSGWHCLHNRFVLIWLSWTFGGCSGSFQGFRSRKMLLRKVHQVQK